MRFKQSGKNAAMSSAQVALVVAILSISVASLAFVNSVSVRQNQGVGSQSVTTQAGASSSTRSSSSSTGSAVGGVETQPAPTTRHITLVAEEAKVEIATNVTYDAWTFNGTVPGPTITVNQGDTVVFTLINNASMAHSIDFHAAQIDWSTAYAAVPPGQSKAFDFVVRYPGVFMYHCGTPPVLEHIANGMYGVIIVNSSTPLPPATGGQYVIIESEFYLNSHPNSDGGYSGNYTRMLSATPDYVVFNGRAFQYQKNPLVVKPNQLVRLYVFNEGPNLWEAFHVIGAIMDTVYLDGNPANALHGLQTVNIPPSGGAIVDMYFPDAGGKNPFVNHAFAYASLGAVGVFQVEDAASAPTSTTSSSSTASIGVSSSTASVRVSISQGAATNTSEPGYYPAVITVVIGANNTVVWTNDDNAPHTVTAGDGTFDSGNLNPGDSFLHTFTSPGTYPYSCSYHPWMKGVVIVKSP